MCRITKKVDGSNGRDYVPFSSFGYVIDQDAINKLGRLEDFEESVGKNFEDYLDHNTLYQHCKRLEDKMFLLERENKALAKEGEEKCEKLEQLNKKVLSLENENKRLNKALDKACEEMTRIHVDSEDGYPTKWWTKEQWKAWCLDENR